MCGGGGRAGGGVVTVDGPTVDEEQERVKSKAGGGRTSKRPKGREETRVTGVESTDGRETIPRSERPP